MSLPCPVADVLFAQAQVLSVQVRDGSRSVEVAFQENIMARVEPVEKSVEVEGLNEIQGVVRECN